MENLFAEENALAVQMAALVTERLKSERSDIFTEEVSFCYLQAWT